jgi:hypothetical protein
MYPSAEPTSALHRKHSVNDHPLYSQEEERLDRLQGLIFIDCT